jgi:FMN reductase
VLGYVRALAEAQRLTTASLAVRRLPAEALIGANVNDPAIQASFAELAAARGVVFATPVYKAAYSGVLKTWLDILPANALAGKPVLPLATGAAPTHALAVDYALSPVLGALGATLSAGGVYLLDSQIQRNEDGSVQLDAAGDERLRGAVAALVRLVAAHNE